jgi:hypothetical protein
LSVVEGLELLRVGMVGDVFELWMT